MKEEKNIVQENDLESQKEEEKKLDNLPQSEDKIGSDEKNNQVKDLKKKPLD